MMERNRLSFTITIKCVFSKRGIFNLQIVTLDTHAKRQSPTERDGRCMFFVAFFVIFYRICKKFHRKHLVCCFDGPKLTVRLISNTLRS